MKIFATLAALLLLTGCATGSATINCAGDSNVCSVQRDGFLDETVYLRRELP